MSLTSFSSNFLLAFLYSLIALLDTLFILYPIIITSALLVFCPHSHFVFSSSHGLSVHPLNTVFMFTTLRHKDLGCLIHDG